MLFRRRAQEDPLAALRGDGTSPFGQTYEGARPATLMPAAPAARPARAGQAPGRIVSRRDTGVLVAGAPRVGLAIEVSPPGEPSFTVSAHVVVAEGSAASVGDTVDVEYDDGRATDVRLRPAIRPAR